MVQNIDVSSQDVYDTYDQEYNIILGSLSKAIRSPNSKMRSHQLLYKPHNDLESNDSEIRRDMKHAQELLDSMKSQLRNIPSKSKFLFQARLLGYQRELESLKQEFNHKALKSMDSELNQSIQPSIDQDQKALLLQESQQKLENQNERIQQSQQLAYETEEIGITVLSNLRNQREQIERTAYTLHETEGNLEKSRRILKRMARRLLANKLVTFLIVGLLLISIGLLVYFKVYLNS